MADLRQDQIQLTKNILFELTELGILESIFSFFRVVQYVRYINASFLSTFLKRTICVKSLLTVEQSIIL